MKIAMFLCLLSASGLLTGCVFQNIAESRDMKEFPPPGKLVVVNDHLIHINCQGKGSPVVIIEQGLYGTSWHWENVQRQMAKKTKVCGYDRPGLGYSEPVDKLIPAREVAKNLNQLLKVGHLVNENILLVGWSAGGLYAREYYNHYPQRVVGMVLVDSSHDQQGPSEISFRMVLHKYLSPLGIARVSGLVKKEIVSSGLPEELIPRQVALYSRSHVAAAMLNESKAFNADLSRHQAPRNLGDLPLLVISRGKPVEEYLGVSPENIEEARASRAKWMKLQNELAALSTNSKHIIATKSGHNIHVDQPDLLVSEINGFIEALRLERKTSDL